MGLDIKIGGGYFMSNREITRDVITTNEAITITEEVKRIVNKKDIPQILSVLNQREEKYKKMIEQLNDKLNDVLSEKLMFEEIMKGAE